MGTPAARRSATAPYVATLVALVVAAAWLALRAATTDEPERLDLLAPLVAVGVALALVLRAWAADRARLGEAAAAIDRAVEAEAAALHARDAAALALDGAEDARRAAEARAAQEIEASGALEARLRTAQEELGRTQAARDAEAARADGEAAARGRAEAAAAELEAARTVAVRALEEETAARGRAQGDLARARSELRAAVAEREAVAERARAEAEAHARSLEELNGQLAQERGARERLQRDAEVELAERDARLLEERHKAAKLRAARDEERRWNAELRTQIFWMHSERGPLADVKDIRGLVLRLAMELLGAEKGLLLSRADEDADGLLDMDWAEGFEHDPFDSAVAQRFAHEVIDHDRTVRENDWQDIENERRTAADAEIRNLVAIPMYMHDRFNGVVICANKEGGFDEWDDDVLLALGDQAGAILQNGRLQGQLRDAYMSTVALLAEAVAAKDPFVHANAQEVSSYVEAVAQRLDVPPGRREELLFGSLLHDVGKLGISERILLKAAPLTPEERSVVELHPRIGARLVEQVPALQPIVQGVLHHHERWDGAGYPEGLAGDDIPLPARIIGVADAFSAMTANRPYRRRLSIDEACAELERCAGSQFDPEVVEAFVDEVRRAPSQSRTPLSIALSDPVVDTWRTDHEPVLGYAASAHIDGLTFLPTHRPLHEAADAAARAARARGDSFAVVMVELTELNDLNRIEGWAAGDDALRTVAAALARLSLDHGGTAGREGGAVLGVVLPGADEARATGVGRALLAELDGRPVVRVTLAASRPDETGEDVMARARAGVAVDATPAAAPAPAAGTEVPPTPSV